LINAKADRQVRLRVANAPKEKIEEITKELQTLTAEFQQVQAGIRASSPRYAALTQPQTLTLKEIQASIVGMRETLIALEKKLVASVGKSGNSNVDEVNKNLNTMAKMVNILQQKLDSIGPRVDQPMTEWDEAFLPERLAASLEHVKVLSILWHNY